VDKKLRLSLIKLIRKEIRKTKTDWPAVDAMCKATGLSDTAFRDKLKSSDRVALLNDSLLSIAYHKRR